MDTPSKKLEQNDGETLTKVTEELIKKLTGTENKLSALNKIMNTKGSIEEIDALLEKWPRQGLGNRTTEIALNEDIYSTLIRNAPSIEKARNIKLITFYTKDMVQKDIEIDSITEGYECIDLLVTKYPNPQELEESLKENIQNKFTIDDMQNFLKTVYGDRYFAYKAMQNLKEDALRTGFIFEP